MDKKFASSNKLSFSASISSNSLAGRHEMPRRNLSPSICAMAKELHFNNLVSANMDIDGFGSVAPKVELIQNIGAKFVRQAAAKINDLANDLQRLLFLHNKLLPVSRQKHIFGAAFSSKFGVLLPVPWASRMKIAFGAAKGLTILHEAEKPVIYRDFKTSSILLDLGI